MILQFNQISKSFGSNEILKDITFNVLEKEKVAVVGVNGAGKTTLFKIITKELEKDAGEIHLKKDASIAYLKQELNFEEDLTIYEIFKTVFQEALDLEKELRKTEQEIAENDSQELLDKYSQMRDKFEKMNLYGYENRIYSVIRGLGFKNSEADFVFSKLSGGKKTRVALGKLLLEEADILLLDEPTNYLDIKSVEWLEDTLKNYPKTLILISHDRYFIDKIVDRVVEIENNKANLYKGSYSDYLLEKKKRREIEEKQYESQDREIKRREESIRILKSFNREKSIKRAESKEKLLEKVERLDKPESAPDKIRFNLEVKRESGNDVLKVENLSKSFAGKELFKSLNFKISKSDKIALLGDNGIGKTSLIKIILGKLEQSSGSFEFGSNVLTEYYEQEQSFEDENLTVFEDVHNAFPKLDELSIRSSLALFAFKSDDVFKKISNLSGGEKGRVSLAKLMLSKGNFLLLDEPTNHLDLFSKEKLEEVLQNYKGTIFFVSHDRYFINAIANKVFELKKDEIIEYHGNYDYYKEKKQDEIEKTSKVDKDEMISSSKEDWLEQKELQGKLNSCKNQISRIEKSIKKLEAYLDVLDKKLLDEEILTNHYELNKVYLEKEESENKLLAFYGKFEKLKVEKDFLEK